MTNQPPALFPKFSSPLPTPSPSGHTAVDSTSATGFTEVAEPGRLTYQAAQAVEGGEPPSGVSEAYGEGAGGGTRIRGNFEWRHTVKVCASASMG